MTGRSLLEHTNTIPECRQSAKCTHNLSEVVFMALCAMMCGFDSWSEIALFAEERERWFRRWLTLPGAEICTTGCAKGDTSFQLDVWQLFRANKRFALGAGILLALIPTNAGPEVDHDRRYMTVEGTARYYPYVGESVEWWVGVTGGLVVVSDRFFISNDPSNRALLGPRGQTLRTEGGSIGLAGGPVVALARHWAVGATLHYGYWFLPSEPAVDSRGNHASLAGRNLVVALGLNVAFRLAL